MELDRAIAKQSPANDPRIGGTDRQIADWASRNDHWLNQNRSIRWRAKRQRSVEPLILCGHGVSLRIDRGTLLIKNGFTHYPQERQEYRLFGGAMDLPPKIIMLDGNGGLTFNVMAWLSEQNIPLVHLNYQGRVVSVIGGSGFAMDPDKVRWQSETRADPGRRLAFATELISAKLASSLKTLAMIVPPGPPKANAVRVTEGVMHELATGRVRNIDQLRMREAIAASAYFKALKGLPVTWSKRWKHPVPDEWLAYQGRTTPGFTSTLTNRNARHPVNAMLNYAYGILNSHMHIQSLADGYDPRRGIFHHDRDDADAFAWVFDLIEPLRPVVDAAVFKFATKASLSGADFVTRSDGVCRLGPQLARHILAIANGAIAAGEINCFGRRS